MIPIPRIIRPWLALLLLHAATASAQNGLMEQVLELRPGWNAVYLLVEPEQNELASLFAGLPVASVWRWLPDDVEAQFTRAPAEGLENLAGWFGWFPEPRPEAFLSRLFRLNGGVAYLIEMEDSASLTLRGRPVYRRIGWRADEFTLTGLPVAPLNAPTFAEFFANSAAHRDQPIYQLDQQGRWQAVSTASTPIQAGEAYWVRTAGNSGYQGRLDVALEQAESLEFSAALTEITVVLRNRDSVAGSFRVRRLDGNTLPLAWLNEDPETGEIGWPHLQEQLILEAAPGEDVFLTLGILRDEFGRSRMAQVLEITDEHGGRILLHAGGNTIQPIAAPVSKNLADAKQATEVVSFAGLWVGEVQIDAVSESQLAGVVPTATATSFSQRVIIHVDSTGQVRLLKDVIQMWEEGTTQPSAVDPTLQVVDRPGRHVLVTDKNLLGQYSGATVRGGRPVGLRYSTIAYDFPGLDQPFEGEFQPGGQIETTLVIEPDLPTNPFLHRYHPDHDNLDAQFLNAAPEAYQVQRDMRFIFAVEDPLGQDPPGWGDSIVGGVYEGTLSGLHKNTIFTAGEFRLRRVSAVPVLNQ